MNKYLYIHLYNRIGYKRVLYKYIKQKKINLKKIILNDTVAKVFLHNDSTYIKFKAWQTNTIHYLGVHTLVAKVKK